MIRFPHSVFALPFALTAAVLAAREGGITGGQVFWIVVAMVAARSAAMGSIHSTYQGCNVGVRRTNA